MKSFLIAVIIAVLFILALFFGARNDQMVNISYFVAQGEFRLPVVLACVFLLGFMISWLLAFYHLAKHKLVIRRLRKQVVQLETQLAVAKPVANTDALISTEKQG
ncbi:lipopolysaccharide assembly protein LapA domain-containing protein [Shewanella sp. NIFS-20-20]|uniref:LapA family protein n=1 Tax=Shewanella sp. NIFS-20-20 TaxID=2853806 RepID=UPI001C44098B|nr:DUF1049 domain-containing protein [Shewanella sp. NIFS-20-20]